MKIKAVLKKAGSIFISALGGVLLVLLGKESWKRQNRKNLGEEIEKRSEQKRMASVNRIRSADARTLTEGYGAACDKINEGKIRFQDRVREYRAHN